MSDKIKTRHYQPSAALIKRNSRDFTRAAGLEKAIAKSALLDTESIMLPDPSLISSAHGRIEEILLTIPAYAINGGNQNPYWMALSDLIKKLPGYTKFIITIHESAKQAFENWLGAELLDMNRFRISALPDHLNFTVWAEDAYVISKNGSKTYFVEPFSFPRYADSLIADSVNNFSEYELTQAPLYFQGGNVLIGDDFFLIGEDYPNNSLDYVGNVIAPAAGESDENLVKRLYNKYLDKNRNLMYVGSKQPVPSEVVREIFINGEKWNEIIYFGNHEGTVQPLFHIDMFITLAGKDGSGKYIVLVGDPKSAYQILGEPVPETAMVEVFDSIALQFAENNFKVIRNPIPLVYMDDTVRKERIWYFATSNNALVEIYGGTKRVFLPTYGHGNWTELVATDNRNKEIWESLGFTVVQLGDFHPFAENLGALHCIKKYLKRG